MLARASNLGNWSLGAPPAVASVGLAGTPPRRFPRPARGYQGRARIAEIVARIEEIVRLIWRAV
jgi:hypothetical protein